MFELSKSTWHQNGTTDNHFLFVSLPKISSTSLVSHKLHERLVGAVSLPPDLIGNTLTLYTEHMGGYGVRCQA